MLTGPVVKPNRDKKAIRKLLGGIAPIAHQVAASEGIFCTSPVRPCHLARVEASAMNIRKSEVAQDPKPVRIDHRDDERYAWCHLRITDVGWDPNLVRIEYLDEEGNPFYCRFETRDDDNPQGVLQDGPSAEGVQMTRDTGRAFGWFGPRCLLPHCSPFLLAALLIAAIGAVILAAR
jgi:hypothetical protein